jgi:hypothetical protein
MKKYFTVMNLSFDIKTGIVLRNNMSLPEAFKKPFAIGSMAGFNWAKTRT